MFDVLSRAVRLVSGAVLGIVLGLSIAAGSASAADPKPVNPQPSASSLKPGLSVVYYMTKVRHIDELRDFMGSDGGKRGTPLRHLNYRTGESGTLTSGVPYAVGAKISGMIKFDKAGTYSLVVNSNDGFTLRVGGKFILEDPGVHPDQYSDFAKLNIAQPGWYALDMLYFQRKGTSTLQLYWTPPGGNKMAIVPASAFAYR